MGLIFFVGRIRRLELNNTPILPIVHASSNGLHEKLRCVFRCLHCRAHFFAHVERLIGAGWRIVRGEKSLPFEELLGWLAVAAVVGRLSRSVVLGCRHAPALGIGISVLPVVSLTVILSRGWPCRMPAAAWRPSSPWSSGPVGLFGGAQAYTAARRGREMFARYPEHGKSHASMHINTRNLSGFGGSRTGRAAGAGCSGGPSPVGSGRTRLAFAVRQIRTHK